MPLRYVSCLIAAGLLGLAAGSAAAQTPQPPVTPDPPAAGDGQSPPSSRLDCPPGVDPNRAPSVGRQDGSADSGRTGDTTGAGGSLSDQLAHSRGVVCPPSAADTGIVESPPGGGALKVIPPPGTPGGEPAPVPK